MKNFNKDELMNLYSKGYSCTQISKLLNTTTVTISNRLKSFGIEVVNKQNIPKIQNNSIIGNRIIELYTSEKELSVGDVQKIIAIEFKDSNISSSNIYSFLHKSNITVFNYQNQSKFDETIFDCIDTEEKAYWLGFIFADGYISRRDNTFEIALKKSDLNHLEKFNTFMKHKNYNIKFGIYLNKYEKCRWSVVNKHLWNTLNNLGCTPRKSLTLTFPNIIQENYYSHFIRGYFDGDGCISYIRNKSVVTPVSSIIGTNEFLTKVKEILNNHEIESNIKSDNRLNNNIKTLYFRKKSEISFLNFLYKNSNIYLERKYNRYKFLINSPSDKELSEFLAGENGKSCDANAVVTEESNKTSEP